MNPRRTLLSIFVQSVKNIFRSYFSAFPKALFISALLLLISGCVTKKQTWQDWMTARESAATNGEPPMILATPVLSTNGPALVLAPEYKIGDGARAGPGFDLAMRNPDFPQTHIEAVFIDLSKPAAGVRIKWTGTNADWPAGPWRETPGRGGEEIDCDDLEGSNTVNSRCTPKGAFPVVGFADHLKLTPQCLYATWVLYAPRFIAIHSHTELPRIPASSGCIRMPYETAKLIHNNSLVGVTIINIYGTWQRPPSFVNFRFKPHRSVY
ncbi:MAG: hypothetical protein QOD03_1687 [Verrucomicrobiota bacterium]|jgi:hypothetical protein